MVHGYICFTVCGTGANTNSANSSSSSSYRYEFPQLCTSSSRAMTDNSSLSTAGETSFSQLIHWHPFVHLESFLLHPQTLFLHPVTHLHPLNSKFTLSRTNYMFSSVSHTTQNFVFFYSPAVLSNGFKSMVFLSACPHMSRTQHVLFQWK